MSELPESPILRIAIWLGIYIGADLISAQSNLEQIRAKISYAPAFSTSLLKIMIQCLKWRKPVKTMAMSKRSAAAITSGSALEPPG